MKAQTEQNVGATGNTAAAISGAVKLPVQYVAARPARAAADGYCHAGQYEDGIQTAYHGVPDLPRKSTNAG